MYSIVVQCGHGHMVLWTFKNRIVLASRSKPIQVKYIASLLNIHETDYRMFNYMCFFLMPQNQIDRCDFLNTTSLKIDLQ